MTAKPITKEEAKAAKILAIPEEVIEAFNELIIEEMNTSGIAIIKCQQAIDRILQKMPLETDVVNRWLDVEPIFEEAGWKVEYDQPGYNESYEAYYTFK